MLVIIALTFFLYSPLLTTILSEGEIFQMANFLLNFLRSVNFLLIILQGRIISLASGRKNSSRDAKVKYVRSSHIESSVRL